MILYDVALLVHTKDYFGKLLHTIYLYVWCMHYLYNDEVCGNLFANHGVLKILK